MIIFKRYSHYQQFYWPILREQPNLLVVKQKSLPENHLYFPVDLTSSSIPWQIPIFTFSASASYAFLHRLFIRLPSLHPTRVWPLSAEFFTNLIHSNSRGKMDFTTACGELYELVLCLILPVCKWRAELKRTWKNAKFEIVKFKAKALVQPLPGFLVFSLCLFSFPFNLSSSTFFFIHSSHWPSTSTPTRSAMCMCSSPLFSGKDKKEKLRGVTRAEIRHPIGRNSEYPSAMHFVVFTLILRLFLQKLEINAKKSAQNSSTY